MSSVEAFTPSDGSWVDVSAVSVPRYAHAAAWAHGFLYIAGGMGNRAIGDDGADEDDGDADNLHHVQLRSCERFNPATRLWSPIADLPAPRANLSLACIRGILYAFGGAQHAGAAGDSETPPWRYVEADNQWLEGPPRPADSAVVTFSAGSSWAAI